jgi:hypothetical protein
LFVLFGMAADPLHQGINPIMPMVCGRKPAIGFSHGPEGFRGLHKSDGLVFPPPNPGSEGVGQGMTLSSALE